MHALGKCHLYFLVARHRLLRWYRSRLFRREKSCLQPVALKVTAYRHYLCTPMQIDLEKLQEQLGKVQAQLTLPGNMERRSRYAQLRREEKKLSELVELGELREQLSRDIAETEKILKEEEDAELQSLARAELSRLSHAVEESEGRVLAMLRPADPLDEKNAILEVRAGTGGDEAAIWAGDLFRMYSRFAEKKGWQMQVVSYTEGTAGGYKEVVATISGEGVYGMLRHEAGVHRVQRVPATESKGRIQTSTATIALLPEVDEEDVTLDMAEVRKDTYCSSGPGGQAVNTTYSAVRLTHIPTGIVVCCQDGRSQQKNLEKAKQVLMARLHEKATAEKQAAVDADRRAMVGTAERSEKIRTYNYLQERVTDHRIGYTQHNLPSVLAGELLPFIERLQAAHVAGQNSTLVFEGVDLLKSPYKTDPRARGDRAG